MLTLKTIIFKLIDILFIFAPNIGYIHQYLKINKMKDSTGFSKFISFILIIAYNLRFFFLYWRKICNNNSLSSNNMFYNANNAFKNMC